MHKSGIEVLAKMVRDSDDYIFCDSHEEFFVFFLKSWVDPRLNVCPLCHIENLKDK